MSKFFDPQGKGVAADKRLYAPATARNRDVILDLLKQHHPGSGTLLEVASGTGEHAACMAGHFPKADWLPSDLEGDKIQSINAWARESGNKNILPAVRFDVLADDMIKLTASQPLMSVMAANLIHIAPWVVAETLIAKAGKALPSGGMLFLYGPFKRNGKHTAPSNESFDASLKSRDIAWGVRDLEAVEKLATDGGFHKPAVIEMPANNLSVIFRKG